MNSLASRPLNIVWRDVLVILVLISLLILDATAVNPLGHSALRPGIAQAAGQFGYAITWHVKTVYDNTVPSSSGTTVSHGDVDVQGSGTVHFLTDGTPYALPFRLGVSDIYVEDGRFNAPTNNGCYPFHTHADWSIVNPARWTGIPDASLNLQADPVRRFDGSYYLPNPFIATTDSSVFPFYDAHPFTYRNESYGEFPITICDNSNTVFFDSPLSSALLQSPGILEGDATGTTFKAHRTFNPFAGFPALGTGTTDWTITVQRLGVCAGHPAPIDDSDPIIVNQQGRVEVRIEGDGKPIMPDDHYDMTVVATCDDVPVKNTEIEIVGDTQENSGGHLHEGDRPRGYLRKQGDASWTRLTDAQPSIKLRTDAQGQILISFRPGRDENCSSCDVAGIAGIYDITAKSTRTPDSPKTEHVYAAVPGLVQLPYLWDAGGLIYHVYDLSGVTDSHPGSHYGTPATLNAVFQVSRQYVDVQAKHSPNSVSLPHLNDMSLKWGGLFDWQNTWTQPHQTHGLGQGFDLDHYGLNAGDAHDWRWQALDEASRPYGSWDPSEYPERLHLMVNQALNNQMGADATMAQPQAVGPDLALVGRFAVPGWRSQATPGQLVTYSLGIDNFDGGADAHGVVLTATLPPGLSFVSADRPVTRMGSAGPEWDMGTLTAGASVDPFGIVARVDAGLTPGTVLTFTAHTTTSDGEALVGNNALVSPLHILSPGADLVLRSSLAGAAMTVDRPVTFSTEVANAGNMVAHGAVLTFTLPASVTLTSANPATTTAASGVVTWDLGDIAPGDTQVVTAGVSLDNGLISSVSFDQAPDRARWLTYTLSAHSATTDIVPINNTEQVARPVELSGCDVAVWIGVQGARAPDQLVPGQDVTYTLNYGNVGNQVAHTATMTMSLWSGLRLVNAQPAPARMMTDTTFIGGVAGWDLGDLQVDGSGVILVRVHVASMPPEGSLVLATIQTPDFDIRPLNNLDQALRAMVVPALINHAYLPLVLR